MDIDDQVRAVDAVAQGLVSSSGRLALIDPGSRAFGADGPGRLGELGHALYAQFSDSIIARSREASALGTATSELAVAVRAAADTYRDVETRRGTGPGSGAA